MANTITSLIPDVYAALDVVSRELVGFIPAVMRDASVERASVGQVVRSFVAPAAAATNITPGVTPPDDGDQTIGNIQIQITTAKRVPFRWNGEQTRGVNNGGPGAQAIQAMQIQQALRTLTNLMETDLANQYLAASRAYGTAGVDPFQSDFSDLAQSRKILADNGAPMSDMHMILSTSAGARMRTLPDLNRQAYAGTDVMLRQGLLQQLQGFDIRESAQIASPAVGTASGATTDNAGYAIGVTSITVASAGSGTIVAGDVVTFAGDTNKYIVVSGVAAAGSGGTLVIGAPGLLVAMSAATKAITVVGKCSKNMFFTRNAMILAARLPALPDGGDLAIDRATVVDPVSGFAFEIAMYAQYRQMQYEISATWGTKMIKPEHAGVLLGL